MSPLWPLNLSRSVRSDKPRLISLRFQETSFKSNRFDLFAKSSPGWSSLIRCFLHRGSVGCDRCPRIHSSLLSLCQTTSGWWRWQRASPRCCSPSSGSTSTFPSCRPPCSTSWTLPSPTSWACSPRMELTAPSWSFHRRWAENRRVSDSDPDSECFISLRMAIQFLQSQTREQSTQQVGNKELKYAN